MPINEITDLTRRCILDYLLDERDEPFHGRIELLQFLARVWDLTSMPSEDERFENAERDIWQHTVNNPTDWDYRYLLTHRLDLETCDDQQFSKFLDECLNPRVALKLEGIDRAATHLNKFLNRDGFELRIEEQVSGWPVYRSVRTGKRYQSNSFTDEGFPYQANKFTYALIDLLMNRGLAREVSLLTFSSGQKIQQSGYDNWNGGQYSWSLSFQVPTHLYARIDKAEIESAEAVIANAARELIRDFDNNHIETVVIAPSLATPDNITEQALS